MILRRRFSENRGRPEFTLDDVYAHEATLSALYPDSRNVRPKIRQQLQLLRDRGWLELTARRGRIGEQLSEPC